MGVARAAVALPRLRLPAKESAAAWGAPAPRGVTRRAVPSWDEDATTLAAEAARALGPLPDLALLVSASPQATPGAATIAQYLGQTAARAVDVGGGAHGGLASLLAALESGGPALALAADVPTAAPGAPAEHAEGAGAAAFLALPGADGAVLEAAASATGESLQDLPPLATATTLRAEALRRLGDAKVDDVPEALRADAGDLGTASVADLAVALGKAAPGVHLAFAAGSPGAATAVRLHVAGPVLYNESRPAPKEIPYVRYLQERRALAPVTPQEPMGAYVSGASWLAEIDARYRLVGRRCGAGHVHYPPRPACPECAAADLEDAPLTPEAEVVSFTVIGRGGAPGEFAAEQAAVGEYPVAVVEFPEGPRLTARLADVERAALRIGLTVRPALRRLYEQQGVVRYGLKFVPAAAP